MTPKRARSSPEEPLLRAVLCEPHVMTRLSPTEWDLLLRQARASTLLARLGYLIAENTSMECAGPPQRHLDGERWTTDKLSRDVLREVRRIAEPLSQIGVRIILLKGAAYVAGDLPAARGRVFSDIDILVPRTVIPLVEQRLKAAGWRSEQLDAWDQRFYRQWMHEVPPLVHLTRETVVDVHHSIVPVTARIRLDANLLFDAAIPAAAEPAVDTLSPEDMVLHSATHLFNEGEFDRGLRDLVDLDMLLSHFGQREGFWNSLIERSLQLDLARPLYYCLRYSSRFLGTPVPASILARSERSAPVAVWLTDFLFEQALRPAHHSCRNIPTPLALWLLYIRAHRIRLPLHLLAPHLIRKSLKRGFAQLGSDRTKETASTGLNP